MSPLTSGGLSVPIRGVAPALERAFQKVEKEKRPVRFLRPLANHYYRIFPRLGNIYCRSHCSDTDRPRGLAFFIDYLRRPNLIITQNIVKPRQVSSDKIEWTHLVEIGNDGKRTARRCRAYSQTVSQKGTSFPPWKGGLEWIRPDESRYGEVDLPYKARARIELFKLTTTTRTLSEDRVEHIYEIDDKPVAAFFDSKKIASERGPSMFPASEFELSIYGEDGVERHALGRIVLSSEPRVRFVIRANWVKPVNGATFEELRS